MGRGFFFGEETVYPKVSQKINYFLRLKNWYDIVCKSHNARVLYIETDSFCNVIKHQTQLQDDMQDNFQAKLPSLTGDLDASELQGPQKSPT